MHMTNQAVQKAVVLAAGWGSRIQARMKGAKPLIPVAGRPILFRTLDVLRSGGIEEIAVIVGYQSEVINQAVAIYNRRERANIQTIFNSRWREANGLSLSAAKDFTAKDDFILTMSDHLLDPQIIKTMQQTPISSDALLAIDKKIDTIADIDDATKVLINPYNRIVSISKSLKSYNAIDCGVFRLKETIYHALSDARREGDASLSAGMHILADKGRFFGVDIKDAYWQDVDDGAMLDAAEELLQLKERHVA